MCDISSWWKERGMVHNSVTEQTLETISIDNCRVGLEVIEDLHVNIRI